MKPTQSSFVYDINYTLQRHLVEKMCREVARHCAELSIAEMAAYAVIWGDRIRQTNNSRLIPSWLKSGLVEAMLITKSEYQRLCDEACLLDAEQTIRRTNDRLNVN